MRLMSKVNICCYLAYKCCFTAMHVTTRSFMFGYHWLSYFMINGICGLKIDH